MKTNTLIFVAGILALSFVACASTGCISDNPNAILVAQANPPVQDVPIPTGFTMDKDSSNRREPTSGVRLVQHTYKGKDHKSAVCSFFKANMPLNGWTAVNESYRDSQWSLQYRKAKEQCDIIIYEKGMFPKTCIGVTIGPVGEASNATPPASK